MTDDRAPLVMNADYASRLAALALAHVSREYPNKLDHVLLSARDAITPRALHPVFFGSFDWHSCVHGYWLLARIYRRYPDIPEAQMVRALFDERLTPANVAVETDYAAHKANAGFERPYGWAWLLQLSAELQLHDSNEGREWARVLSPLASVFARRFVEFLPKATYPTRTGTHYNSAFAIVLAMKYADLSGDTVLATTLRSAAVRWFSADRDAPAWEPGGDDFLSGTLVEALCMQGVLAPHAFTEWFASFLPRIAERQPETLFSPVTVSDRSDGKIAHLDGLNLSRAWAWRRLAHAWPPRDSRREAALAAATLHLQEALPHIAGDYMGEHWLATYAMLALEAGQEE